MHCRQQTLANHRLLRHSLHTLVLLTLFLALPLLSPQIVRAGDAALVSMADGNVKDVVSGKLWQLERSSRRYKDSEKVDDYLAQLGKESGRSWRLPTKDEFSGLYEIFDLKRNEETIMQLDGNYWFTNKDGKPAVGAWESGVGCGPVRDFYLKKKGYVRAISDTAQ